MATHLGVVDEEQINDMSYVFFEDVLDELGHKLLYDAAVNYAGNSFCDKSWDIIMDYYPMSATNKLGKKGEGVGLGGLAKMISGGKVKVMNKGKSLPGSLGRMQKGKHK